MKSAAQALIGGYCTGFKRIEMAQCIKMTATVTAMTPDSLCGNQVDESLLNENDNCGLIVINLQT